MADCMMFPKDWHDFIKDYSFIDSERVYTNGSELIQVLRVTQLIEHLLNEQEKLKKKLLQNIADNQLAVSPTGYETEEGLAKRTGEWNGLQMAYEIVLNDGN